ncbi:MAG: HlyD family efflux transporter periplasmic adaptor subunit [Rhodanobacter sp.]|jgi:RND family efflux transporter MFP subunit|nr:HlyD family efflux transporter periplasmic adaptor subunit [Rhodanobacter sp.]
MRRTLVLVSLLALMLAGVAACSGENVGAPSAAASVRSAYLAMARGEVDVEGGLIRIVAPRDGRVNAVAVEDGAVVKQGDVLVELDRRQVQIAIGLAEANLGQTQAQAKVLETRLGPAQVQAKRLREAAGAGAATGQSADDAAAALTALKAEAAVAEAAVKVARQRVDEARVELDARTIRAPAAGRIVRRSVHVGDAVSAQSASELFQLLPDRPRIVRAELNEAYVDLVKVGMRAEVVRDADQDRAVPATVVRIGEVFGTSRLTDDPVERVSAHEVECVLHLEGGDFRIGQRVLVRFVRE